MPRVNPEILRWARETAALALDEAAHKLGLSDDRLAEFERGAREPSRAVLVKMAEKYRRPLLTFYLPKPPRRSDRGQDFRTLPEAPPPGDEALLDALLRDVQARQGLVRSALEEAEEDVPVAFVGSAAVADGVDAVVATMQRALGVTSEQFRAEPSADEAFKLLRGAAERAGVFVLLLGNLGSHHSAIDVRLFRGFALADAVAPFVVVNENDARAAWSFTLLHELAHLWLGQTGVSGYGGETDVEKFCDAVAARFLLDPAELRELGPVRAATAGDLKLRIDAFAGARNLSRKMVAYNLLRSGAIVAATYRQLSDLFDDERTAQRAREREGEGGPDYYVVRRHRIGASLIGLVGRMITGGAMSTTEAGRVLGVKPTNVARLVASGQAA
jgi:Zn-dependent peptidase ImmA (M78 family)/transcriptional regulator with XRE-family HTH domain